MRMDASPSVCCASGEPRSANISKVLLHILFIIVGNDGHAVWKLAIGWYKTKNLNGT